MVLSRATIEGGREIHEAQGGINRNRGCQWLSRVTCPNAVVIFGLAPTGRILEVANFTLSSEEMNVQEAAPRAKNKRDT